MTSPVNRYFGPGSGRYITVGITLTAALITNAAVLWVAVGWPSRIGQTIFDLILIAWLTLPMAMMSGLAATGRLGFSTFVLTALPLEAVVAWFAYSSLTDTTSSTAALGALWAPILGVVAAFLVWFTDMGVRALFRGAGRPG